MENLIPVAADRGGFCNGGRMRRWGERNQSKCQPRHNSGQLYRHRNGCRRRYDGDDPRRRDLELSGHRAC